MKLKPIIITIAMLVLSTGYVFASGNHDHGAHEQDEVEEVIAETAINVGNKICPVSEEKIGSMGKAYTVEHEGKVYNLCCKMCAKDFKKNPEKYIKKISEELESSDHKKDDHDEDKGSHKGSHKGSKGGNGHDGHDH